MDNRLSLLVALFFVAASVIACSEPATEPGQTLNVDEQQDAGSCEDGETFDSDTGECVDERDTGTDDEEDAEGCGEDETYDPISEECVSEGDDDCSEANLTGRVCDPDNNFHSEAEITIEGADCEGDEFSFTTTADTYGYYEFKAIPSGDSHEKTVTVGSWEVIRSGITVEPGETAVFNEGCPDFAVIEGGDEDVIAPLESWNFEFDRFDNDAEAGDLLMDFTELSSYDTLVVENGATVDDATPSDDDADEIRDNLQQFVAEGNTLMTTESARSYAFATAPQIGGHDDDYDPTSPSPAAAGESQTVTADVEDDELQSRLGTDTVEIVFPDFFNVVTDPDPEIEILLSGDVVSGDTYLPAKLMLVYEDDDSEGRVIYNAFRLSAQSDDLADAVLDEMLQNL